MFEKTQPDARPISVLIVDDEALARQRIRDLLREFTDVNIAEECSTGTKAIETIKRLKPDIVFLDVQMPGIDGVTVAGEICEASGLDAPLFIFVTAYDQYALRAFELQALDYLLKPFDRDRFRIAFDRALRQLASREKELNDSKILKLLEDMNSRSQYLDRMVLNSGNRSIVVKTDEIDWIEAEGNYVRIHFGKQSSLLRETLAKLESQLDPRKFTRIHRSQIVNIDHVRELQPWSHRGWRLVMLNGTELSLTRTYRDQVYRLLGKL
jgi:two-component system, LytTR family, response regulator